MEIIKDLFDTYSRKARLQPTLLVLSPAVVTVLLWIPSTYNAMATIVSIAATLGVITLLTNWTRTRGRNAEVLLFKEWGGKPTTIWLRHQDTNLDDATTQRYHTFLELNVRNWTPPTPDEETQNMAQADGKYDSAVRWMLEYTRDTKRFPLVFCELISYGFRRNLYGMKTIGVSLSVLALIINGILLYLYQPEGPLLLITSLLILGCGCSVLIWMFVVTKEWVKDSAYAYARALLASCDSK